VLRNVSIFRDFNTKYRFSEGLLGQRRRKSLPVGGAKEGQFVLRALERVALKYKSTVYIPKPSRITKGQKWLANKRLVAQNIDGLDGKAGNAEYVPIHGRLDRATVQSFGTGGYLMHRLSSYNCRLACMRLN